MKINNEKVNVLGDDTMLKTLLPFILLFYKVPNLKYSMKEILFGQFSYSQLIQKKIISQNNSYVDDNQLQIKGAALCYFGLDMILSNIHKQSQANSYRGMPI